MRNGLEKPQTGVVGAKATKIQNGSPLLGEASRRTASAACFAMLGSSLDLPSCPQPPMFYRDASDRRIRQHHQVHLTAVALGQWRSLAYGSADKACLCNTESQGSNWIIHRDGITSQSFFRISDASNAYCYRWMALRCRSGCLDKGPAGKVLRRSRSRKMLGKCLQ